MAQDSGLQLFDPQFLQEAQALTLRIAQAQRGGRLAEQRTAARGQGSEFADFKPYASGDDLRAIDWNVYQRLGKVFVRVFEEQQDMPVYFLVDHSASMGVEQPPRLHAALRATFALAAIALGQQDSVSVLPFASTMQVQVKGLSGRGNLMRLANQLQALQAQGDSHLVDALRQVAATRLRRGLLVVVSDFFDPAGADAIVQQLQAMPHRVLLVQMVRGHDADPRLHPDLRGDVRIDDGEPGRQVDLALDPALLKRYEEAYTRFSRQLSGFGTRAGTGLVRIDAAGDVLQQLGAVFDNGELRL